MDLPYLRDMNTMKKSLIVSLLLISSAGFLGISAKYFPGAHVYGFAQAVDSSVIETQNVQDTIAGWGPESQQLAAQMIKKYGNPQEITPSMIIWYNNGVWEKTVVYKQAMEHDFPVQHNDLLEQTIVYRLPIDHIADVTTFDGSLTFRRTSGELSSAGNSEAMNFLALNLANDIVTHNKTVVQARTEFTNDETSLIAHQQPDYALGLRFAVSPTDNADPDAPTM